MAWTNGEQKFQGANVPGGIGVARILSGALSFPEKGDDLF